MSWQLLATGDRNSLDDIIGIEQDQIDEGQRARLECECIGPVPSTDITALRNSLSWAGIEDVELSSSGSKVNVTWRKGFAWAPIIILILVAVIVIVLWRFFGEVASTVGPIPTTILIVGGALLAGALAFRLIKGGINT
jgi:hypothetical protein